MCIVYGCMEVFECLNDERFVMMLVVPRDLYTCVEGNWVSDLHAKNGRTTHSYVHQNTNTYVRYLTNFPLSLSLFLSFCLSVSPSLTECTLSHTHTL